MACAPPNRLLLCRLRRTILTISSISVEVCDGCGLDACKDPHSKRRCLLYGAPPICKARISTDQEKHRLLLVSLHWKNAERPTSGPVLSHLSWTPPMSFWMSESMKWLFDCQRTIMSTMSWHSSITHHYLQRPHPSARVTVSSHQCVINASLIGKRKNYLSFLTDQSKMSEKSPLIFT